MKANSMKPSYCIKWTQNMGGGRGSDLVVYTDDHEAGYAVWEALCKDKLETTVRNVDTTFNGKKFNPAEPWPRYPHLMPESARFTDGWWIPHPGTLEWTACVSFDEAISKYYEGFNLPRMVNGGIMESIADASRRISLHEQRITA